MVSVRYIPPDTGNLESLVGSQTSDSHQNTIRLVYLAEGNANVIYRLVPLEGGELPLGLQGRLVRLRKDKPFIQRTEDQHASLQQHFAPLFSNRNLVHHTLVALQEDTLAALNVELNSLQTLAARGRLRHHDKLAEDEVYGTFITDMTARSDEILIELKPKWLLQSPDAPPGATRCRTCALRAQRVADKAEGGLVPQLSGFCPLSLINGTLAERYKAAQEVVRSRSDKYTEGSVEQLAGILTHGAAQLLETLRHHQFRLDPTGVLSLPSERIRKDFLMAMTLRDCTLLIRATAKDQSGIEYEARLADLDLKQADPSKVTKWKDTEKRLIEEGWYLQPVTSSSEDTLCYLSR